MTLRAVERAVLETYNRLDAIDAEVAWNVVAAVERHGPFLSSGADVAYMVCKALKRKGLLTCRGVQRPGLFNASAYLITDEGRALVEKTQ